MSLKNVAVIVVSSQILSGEENDVFSQCLSKELISLGFNIEKIAIIRECEANIVAELVQLLRSLDYVFLIGKLEPGVTNAIYKASAKVFKQELISNQELNSALAELHRNGVTESLIPASTKVLIPNCDNCLVPKVHPVLYNERLFIIPKDESNFSYIIQNVLKPFPVLRRKDQIYSKSICLRFDDKYISLLERVDKNCRINVSFEKQNTSLLVKLQSSCLSTLLEMESSILRDAGNDVIYSEENQTNVSVLYQELNVLSHIRQAISYIEDCFSKYGPDNVFLSFNGGKDCTVLLHLVLVILRRNYPDYKKPMVCLYVKTQQPFEEVDDFITKIQQYYNIKTITFTKGIKESLASILDMEKQMRACLMGTRRTDPYSNDLQIFQMTDNDWPQVMRVNPILDWHYSDVWDYLLMFNVPYCSLYDQGYTSLGSKVNTLRNPELLDHDVDNTRSYLPAYKLLDGSKERCGRMTR